MLVRQLDMRKSREGPRRNCGTRKVAAVKPSGQSRAGREKRKAEPRPGAKLAKRRGGQGAKVNRKAYPAVGSKNAALAARGADKRRQTKPPECYPDEGRGWGGTWVEEVGVEGKASDAMVCGWEGGG